MSCAALLLVFGAVSASTASDTCSSNLNGCTASNDPIMTHMMRLQELDAMGASQQGALEQPVDDPMHTDGHSLIQSRTIASKMSRSKSPKSLESANIQAEASLSAEVSVEEESGQGKLRTLKHISLPGDKGFFRHPEGELRMCSLPRKGLCLIELSWDGTSKNTDGTPSYVETSGERLLGISADGSPAAETFTYFIPASGPFRIILGSNVRGGHLMTHGGDVLYAGRLHIGAALDAQKSGQLLEWTNNSGHYKPPADAAPHVAALSQLTGGILSADTFRRATMFNCMCCDQKPPGATSCSDAPSNGCAIDPHCMHFFGCSCASSLASTNISVGTSTDKSVDDTLIRKSNEC